MKFTLVSTVFNEMSRLDLSIDDIEAQTLLPDEIIITDAGSTDGTYERLLRWKSESKISINILLDKGCNIARGRNLAIELASYPIIASTDFGCRFHSEWLESIIKPFESSNIDVVGGNFKVDEAGIKSIAARADYILQNGFSYTLDDTFSVSSRSIAYKKKIWEEIGGYQEWLSLAADDTIFWRQIKKRQFSYRIIKQPFVYWGRHETFKQFAKESGRYGLGDGESGINFKNFISTSVETMLRYFLFITIVYLILSSQLEIWMIIFTFLIFGLRSYLSAIKKWSRLCSSKYHFGVLIASFWLIEWNRVYYIRSYLKAWLFQRRRFQKFQKELGIV